MNGKGLLIGLSYIDWKYIEESETYLPAKKGLRPGRRIWLIAAAIALTLLLVGCAVVVYTRIQMKMVQHHVPVGTTAAAAVTDASAASETEPVRNPLTSCYPQSLPTGYRMEVGEQMGRYGRRMEYRNAEGKTISFQLSTYEPVNITLAPPMEKITMTVSGYDALMQVKEDAAQAFTWHNEGEGYYASLYTEDMAVDLQALAESVDFGEALPLTFLCREGEIWNTWYPQQLPTGYICRSVSPFSNDVQIINYSNHAHGITYAVSLNRDFGAEAAEPPNDPFTWEDLTVAGQPARMMTTPGQRMLYWHNAQEGFYAMLIVADTDVDILALAEGVAPGEPPAISSEYLGPDYTIELEQDKETYVGWEPIYPQWVPEGFVLSFVSDPAYGQQTIRYQNAAEEEIIFMFYFRLGQWGRQFDGMGQPEEVIINGSLGYRLGNSLIWTDEEKGFGFTLDCPAGVDPMAVAESVGPGPELKPTLADNTAKALEQLGDYRITALPDGMMEDAITGMPLEDGGGWYSYVRRWYIDPNTNAQIYFEYESYAAGENEEPSSLEVMARNQLGVSTPAQYHTICGCTGAAAQDGEYAVAVWIAGDSTKGTIFRLSSQDYPVEELLNIAQSVQQQ